MTTTLEPVTPPQFTPPSERDAGADGKPRRRRIRWVVTVVIVLVALIIGVTGWLVTAAMARSSVQILTADTPLVCTPAALATTTEASLDDINDTIRVPAIRVSGPFECELSYVVANGGSVPVSLNAVRFAAGTPLMQVHVGTIDIESNTIDPGQSTTVHIPLTWSKGCLVRGGTTTNLNEPHFVLSALGASGTISRFGPALAFLGTKVSDAACPWHKQ